VQFDFEATGSLYPAERIKPLYCDFHVATAQGFNNFHDSSALDCQLVSTHNYSDRVCSQSVSQAVPLRNKQKIRLSTWCYCRL